MEDLFIDVVEIHDVLEYSHPDVDVILEIGVKVLIVEVVEDLKEDS